MDDAMSRRNDLAAAIEAVTGKGSVSTDPARRALFSQDVWAKGETALAVVRPAKQDACRRAPAGAGAAKGWPAFPRAGGHVLPTREL